MQSPSLPVEAEFKRLAVGELDPLFRFFCFLTRDAERTADLIVDVYTRAFRRESLEEFNTQAGGMRVWLMALARTSFSERPENEYAGARAPGQAAPAPADDGGGFTLTPIPSPPPLPTNSDGVDVPAPSEVGSVDWANAGPRLSAGVASLSEELREVLWLWAMEGMNYREIGEVLLVPIETVMNRLHRARALATRFVVTDAFVCGGCERAPSTATS